MVSQSGGVEKGELDEGGQKAQTPGYKTNQYEMNTAVRYLSMLSRK